MAMDRSAVERHANKNFCFALLLRLREKIKETIGQPDSNLYGIVSVHTKGTQVKDPSGNPRVLLKIQSHTPARARYKATHLSISVPPDLEGNRVEDGVSLTHLQRPHVFKVVPLHSNGHPFEPVMSPVRTEFKHPLFVRESYMLLAHPNPHERKREVVVAMVMRWVREFVLWDPSEPRRPEEEDSPPLLQGTLVLVHGLQEKPAWNGRLALSLGSQKVRARDGSVRELIIGLEVGPERGFWCGKVNLTQIVDLQVLVSLFLERIVLKKQEYERAAKFLLSRNMAQTETVAQHEAPRTRPVPRSLSTKPERDRRVAAIWEHAC